MGYDGYIRVSRVGGRGGDSFISPDVQRERINAWATSKGIEISAWHEDFDQSGGKTTRPGLDIAMERCRLGLSDGIVVAKIDRFARTLLGALELIRTLEDTGAEFVSVAEGIDSTTPSGKMMQRLMLILAEFELDRIRDTWNDARSHAVARGVHISSATPSGYVRQDDKTFQIDPEHAPAIRKAFEMAAAGSEWRIIGTYLNNAKVPGPYGRVNWIVQNVKNVITNPVYKGEARSGEFVNKTAHEPIVSAALWDRANHQRKSTPARSLEPALLSGIIRCAGCQHILRPDSMTRISGPDKGKRMRTYRCRKEYASGICSAPAAIAGWTIEPWVIAKLDEHLHQMDFEADGVDAVERIADLERDLESASLQLELFRDQAIEGALGVERFAEGLRVRAAHVEEARLAIAKARGVSGPGRLAFMADTFESMTLDEKRSILNASIDSVMIRRGKMPIDDRAMILWAGERPDSFPGRGKRRPLKTFDWPNSPN